MQLTGFASEGDTPIYARPSDDPCVQPETHSISISIRRVSSGVRDIRVSCKITEIKKGGHGANDFRGYNAGNGGEVDLGTH